MRPLRPWQRLQWRLTLACVGATLGLALLLVGALLAVAGNYLLRSQGMAVDVAAEVLSKGMVLAPAMAATPPDVAAMERILFRELAQGERQPVPQENALEVEIRLGGPSAGTVGVLDAKGTPLLAVDFARGGVSRGEPFRPSSEEAVLIGRALSGVTAPESLGLRGENGGLVAAVPVRDAKGHVLGAVVARMKPPMGPRDFAGSVLGFILALGVPLVLLGTAVGLVVGWLSARRLLAGLRPLTSAADAWSRGELDVVASVRPGDELAVLADRLNQMAGQLRSVVGLRQELAAREERDRLARDLHDTVKQHLFAAAMQLGAAKAHLSRQPERAEACLNEASELVGTSQRELVSLLQELRPRSLEGRWPEPLRQQVDAWSARTGIAAEVRLEMDTGPLPPAVAEALLRILQEALANVARHSGASRVRVWLGSTGPSRHALVVEDDGRGLPAERRGGMGLDIMRERTEALPDGQFRLGTGEALSGLRVEAGFSVGGGETAASAGTAAWGVAPGAGPATPAAAGSDMHAPPAAPATFPATDTPVVPPAPAAAAGQVEPESPARPSESAHRPHRFRS
jgi:NarL family two-component system sensor histidine kinase LiaS